MCQSETQMLMDSGSIGIFDQYMGMTCAKGRLRCSWIHGIDLFDQYEGKTCPKLDSDVHAYHWY